MRDLASAADLIDRAIDDKEASGGADVEASFARELATFAQRLQLEPERSARVRDRVAAASAQADGSGRQRPGRWDLLRRALWSRKAAAAAALAGVGLLVVLLATPSVPADAHEIVAKLERGSIDPSAVGLTRYAGTLRATSWTGPGGRLGVPIVADERVWFQAPKNLRLETTLATTSAATTSAPTTTVLMDGTQSWLWTPATHSAFRLSATSTGTLAFLTGSEVQAALANLSRDYAAASDGSETIAGRATDRVILTPMPGGAVSVEVGRVVLSVDRERSIPLAGRVLDRSNQPVFEWAFNQIDFAPSFDSSIFVFAPEPGTTIVDLPSTGAVGAEAKWRELARGTTFTLFRPTFRSNTLEPGYPSRDQDRVVVSYRSATDLAAILIIEMAATNAFEPGEAVSLPTGAAVYRRDADRQRLIVRREGTRIELQAPLGGNRDDLMNAAASLVAVR